MPINPTNRFRGNLWPRRFKNYLQCALMLFVGYQLAWHKNELGGHPGRALFALGALVFGAAIVVAALKTASHKHVNVHRAWILAGFIVVALATAYGTSVVRGVKWSSLWVVFAVLALLVVSEIAIRDHVLKSIKKRQFGAKLPRFVPRVKVTFRQSADQKSKPAPGKIRSLQRPTIVGTRPKGRRAS